MNREDLREGAIYNLQENRFEVFFNDMSTRPKKSCGWVIPAFKDIGNLGVIKPFVDAVDLRKAIDMAWIEIQAAGGFYHIAVDVEPGELIPIVNLEKHS